MRREAGDKFAVSTILRPISPIARRLRHRRGGQSLVEFAVVAPLFFIFIFGLIDFSRLFFTQMTLQHAVREAGRYAVTGNHLPDPNNPTQPKSRLVSITEIAQRASGGMPITGIQVESNGVPNYAGGPSETVRISLTQDFRIITPIIGQFFPNGVYHFTVSTVFKNEPFPRENAN